MKNTWLTSYEESERKEEARTAVEKYCPTLREMGVTRVLFHFEGSGDSGQIERVEVRVSATPEGVVNRLARWGMPDYIEAALTEAAYDTLPGGWEINEGSSGVITLDVISGTLDVDIRWNPNEADPDSEEEEEEDASP